MTDAVREKQDKLSFDAALRAVRERLERALTQAPPVIRAYTAHLAGAQGKMIRAHALLACAQGEDGLIDPDAAAFAAGIELLHLATLVHDDVMDDADTRRGIPTLQRRFGRKTAVICGDYLLSAALRLAASVPDRDRFVQLELPDYVGRVCMGELRQNIHNGDFGLGVGGYLRIIRGKTAALFECSFLAGTVLATGDKAQRDGYARLGRYIGMIFQLTDDCIDYSLDAATAKKPVQSDYAQGVVTLPLIHALAHDPELRARVEREKLDPDEVGERVRGSGGLDYTRWLARRYYGKAEALLEALNPAPEKRERLRAILEKSYCGPRPASQCDIGGN